MHEHHHNISAESEKELLALVEYMAKHNASHADELKKIAEKLKENKNAEASRKVLAATDEYEKGNALLSEALELLKKGENK